MAHPGNRNCHRLTGTVLIAPGPAKTGFLDALQNAEASQTGVYAKLAEPGPVVDAGLRALDRGVPVVVPGLRNQAIAFLPRITPRRLITSLSGRYLAPKAGTTPPGAASNHAIPPPGH